MALTGQQLSKIHSIMIRVFNEASLRRFLLYRLDERLDHRVGSGNLEEQVFELLEWADSSGNMLRLLQAAQEERPREPELEEVLSMVQGGRAASHFDVFYINNVQPFLNRKVLRQHLRDLHDGSRRVLLIQGQSRSGKSHSSKLIDYCANQIDRHKVICVDFHHPPRGGPGAEAIVRRIATVMNMDLALFPSADQKQTRPGEWSDKLCSWLVDNLPKPRRVLWLIFDHCGESNFPDDTRDLIASLVRRAATDAVQLRIVLVNYTDPLAVDDDQLHREMISWPGLQDLTLAVESAFVLATGEEPHPDVTDLLVGGVMRVIDNDFTNLQQMADALQGLPDKIRRLHP